MVLFAIASHAGPSQVALQRNNLPRTLGALTQRRNAVVRNQPKQKTAQTIGKLQKKNLSKRMEEKLIWKRRDLAAFSPMPLSRLMTPAIKDKGAGDTKVPAYLDPLFEPGQSHSLDLPPFEPTAITSENIGTAAQFDFKENDPARIFGVPKKLLMEFRILTKPCSVIRGVTVETIETLEKAKESPSLDSRLVLSGRAGCGKSFLLLQAVQYSAAKNWIVIYIPRGVNLVNSTTSYAYDLRTQTYLQSSFAYQTIQRLYTVNTSRLSKLLMRNNLVLEKQTIPAGTTLSDLAQTAIKEKSQVNSTVILDALMKELEGQTQYPVLLAVDDFQALFNKSAYRDPFFNHIKPFHLSMPRLILEFASGKRSFAKGAFLGALNASDTNYGIPLELRDTLKLEYLHPTSPYDRRSRDLLGYAQGMRALHVPAKLSVQEASSLFELWKQDLALHSRAYDEVFLSKYLESDGNARDFVWKGILSTFSP